MFWGFIYVTIHCGLFISMIISTYSIVCIIPQFIISTVDILLSCFQTLAIIKSGIMNILPHTFWYGKFMNFCQVSVKFFSKPCVFLLECRYAFWNNITRDSERCFYFFVHVEKLKESVSHKLWLRFKQQEVPISPLIFVFTRNSHHSVKVSRGKAQFSWCCLP